MIFPPQVLIIADDLTGAADAAAGIASRGLVTRLSLKDIPSAPADALVFTTESRALPPDEAVREVSALVESLRAARLPARAKVIYKKIDSTLRGHPALELEAMMEKAGIDRVLVAPAFPPQGRTTINGRQLLEGVPLERTEFGRDVPTSDLGSIFGGVQFRRTRLGIRQVRSSEASLQALLDGLEPGIVLCDAETDADLARLARAASACRLRLFCGSAGLMAALMRIDGWASRVPASILTPATAGPGLIVAGSRHERTRAQIGALAGSGISVVRVPSASDSPQSSHATLAEEVGQPLVAGRNVALAAEIDDRQPTSREMARRMAEIARKAIERTPAAFLVLTGGDTAAAVCQALDVSSILLLGEISPGIPHGRLEGGLLDGLPVATKAGGFGEPDALARILEFLNR